MGGSGGTGGGINSGDCDDVHPCPVNSQCVELVPGGFRVCATSTKEATSCPNPAIDECCKSADCSSGALCYAGPVVPHCGGAIPSNQNVCAKDFCSSDADCGNGEVCLPAGVLGNEVRACLSAKCRTDADCTVETGGQCAPVMNPCCNAASGLFCVYPGGCRKTSDCAVGKYCSTASGEPTCVQGAAVCPG